MKKLGIATTVGGAGLGAATSTGDRLLSTQSTNQATIEDIATEAVEHPSRNQVAFTTNVYDSGYLRLCLANDTASVSDVPSELTSLSHPRRLGVYDLNWRDETTLEYQDGLDSRRATIDTSGVSSIQSVEPLEVLGMDSSGYTVGILPQKWKNLLGQSTDAVLRDADYLADEYGDALTTPSAIARPYYNTSMCTFSNSSYSVSCGGGPLPDPTPTPSDSSTPSPTPTATPTPTPSPTPSPTPTPTPTYDLCDAVHYLNIGKALPRPWKDIKEYFKVPCADGSSPDLIQIPVYSDNYHVKCDDREIKMSGVELWIAIDPLVIKGKRAGCELYVGLKESVTGLDICHKFCDLNLKAIANSVITPLENIYDAGVEVFDWVESQVPDVSNQTLELIMIAIVVLLIVGAIISPADEVLALLALLEAMLGGSAVSSTETTATG